MRHPLPRAVAALFTALAALVTLAACTLVPPDTPQDAAAAPTATGDAASLLPARIKEAGVLRVGSPQTNQPYIYTSDSGPSPQGVIPDLARAVGQELGVRVEFVDIPFPGLIPALQAGRIDAIWSVMSVSDERLQVLDFVDYVKNTRGFLVKHGKQSDLTSLESLCGHSVGVLRGDSTLPTLQQAGQDCTAAGRQEITLRMFDDAGAGRTQVQSGGVDAWLGDLTPLKYAARSVDDGRTFSVADFTLEGVPYGIGLAKTDTQLARSLQQALVNVKESGTYDRVLEKYDATTDALPADGFHVED